MKRFSFRLFGILLSFFLTGCFEWHETMHLEADGSGTYQLLIDLSPSKILLDTSRQYQPDSTRFTMFAEDVYQAFRDGSAQLSELNGISVAKPTYKPEQYQFGLSFHFADLDALNHALNYLAKTEEKAIFFRADKKYLYRTQHFPFEKFLRMKRAEQSDQDAQNSQKLREDMIQEARFAFSLRAAKRIQRYKNDKYKKIDKHNLKLEAPLRQIIQDPGLLRQEIRLK